MTSTRCARCSRPPPARRSRSVTSRWASSSRPSSSRRSPPTPWLSAASTGSRSAWSTAHRSKGLEWRLVGGCARTGDRVARPAATHEPAAGRPDRREKYAAPVIQPETSARELLAEERRLFYVACTRARRAAGGDCGRLTGRRGRATLPVSHRARCGDSAPPGSTAPAVVLAGLVSELRRTASDPRSNHADPRRCHCAALPASRPNAAPMESPLVPAADPATWWGTRDLTHVGAAGATGRRTCRAVGQCPGPGWSSVRRSGSWSARPVVGPSPARHRASATWCTRSPTGSPRASSQPTPALLMG